jgi:hypothetical protein
VNAATRVRPVAVPAVAVESLPRLVNARAATAIEASILGHLWSPPTSPEVTLWGTLVRAHPGIMEPLIGPTMTVVVQRAAEAVLRGDHVRVLVGGGTGNIWHDERIALALTTLANALSEPSGNLADSEGAFDALCQELQLPLDSVAWSSNTGFYRTLADATRGWLLGRSSQGGRQAPHRREGRDPLRLT